MRISGKQIAHIVAEFYNLSFEDMQSPVRNQMYAVPRQICMYMMRRHAKHLSYPAIGKILERHHTTVLHGERNIATARLSDAALDDDLNELDQMILDARQRAAATLSSRAAELDDALEAARCVIAPLHEQLQALTRLVEGKAA